MTQAISAFLVPLGRVALGAVVAMALALTTVSQAQEDSLTVSDNGNVGLGIELPNRQLHMRGNNAAFRMDRDADSAAFILTRTAAGNFNTVWKTYVVGVNASGANNGEFVINDLGAAAGGGGIRRMTIANNGTVTFTGVVNAPSFNSTSSLRYKHAVETLTGVPEALASLRGVRFAWKESGKQDIGLIAEEVAAVYPELVQRDAETGAVESVNYPALVAVLIEGYKAQQEQLALQEQRVSLQEQETTFYRDRLAAIERQQNELAQLKAQMTEITDRLLPDNRPVLAQR